MFFDFYKVSRDDFLEIVGLDTILSNMTIRFSETKKTVPYEMSELIEKGYRIVPMITHHFWLRIEEQVIPFLKENVDKNGVAGVINFPMLFCEDDYKYKLMFEATDTMRIIKENADYFG